MVELIMIWSGPRGVVGCTGQAPYGPTRLFNTNTFAWSGPSGVLGCTGQRRVAPGPTRPLCAIEPIESPDSKKTSAEEKDYDSVVELVIERPHAITSDLAALRLSRHCTDVIRWKGRPRRKLGRSQRWDVTDGTIRGGTA
jgi:hypothetical protein